MGKTLKILMKITTHKKINYEEKNNNLSMDNLFW